MGDGQDMLQAALHHHQAGRLAEAEKLYRHVLAADSGNADAFNLLGVIAHQTGRNDNAVELIGQALAINRNAAPYYLNLGVALFGLQRLEDAVTAYGNAIRCDPDFTDAHYNLAIALTELGRLEEAAAANEAAIGLRPGHAEAHCNLGNVFKKMGRLDDAVSAYQAAIRGNPDFAEAHYNLGNGLFVLGRLDDAVAAYQAAVVIKPDYAEAHYNQGNALFILRRLTDAAAAYVAAIDLKPDRAEFHANLGNALKDLGQLEAAVTAYQTAIGLKADFAEAFSNLGIALGDQGRLTEATMAFEQALAHRPDYADAEMNLAAAQLYRSGVGLADILSRARRFGTAHAAGLPGFTHARPADSRRSPRIGFISADFRSHAAGFNALPAIEGLARLGFHLVCYSNSARHDDVTARFIEAATMWRPVAGMSDEDLAGLIRADGIDILVDLSGYTAGNRLLVFARKPAPIQVTWLGYQATTGLATMDYILADRAVIPEAAEAFYSEKPLCLPQCWMAYEPPPDDPPVGALPASARGYVTFGAFNAMKKVTPEVVAAWSSILRNLPSSRLLLKAAALTCPATRRRFAEMFSSHGIAAERLQFVGSTSSAEHRAWMRRTDIALDPFPYSGCVTTLDALWSGVPVIALPGETYASRQSLSFLSCIGLGELAAISADRYIDLAVGLAGDLPRLAEMRAGLRSRMLASPLCDADRFAGDLAAALTMILMNS